MESKFTGGLLGWIGINILSALLTIFTIGIGGPAATCMKERWIASHTYIDGEQLVFDGTGTQLWGKVIVWIFLIIITLGFFLFWLPLKSKAWIASHTHILGR